MATLDNPSWATPWRLLGLDVGDRRIGVAVSDPMGMLATPVEVYRRRDLETDLTHIADLRQELDAVRVIVGLPVNMNGSEGPQAGKTREFAEALAARGLEVSYWDERLSTVEAARRREERRGNRRKDRSHVDAEAAAVILETYLNHARSRGEGE